MKILVPVDGSAHSNAALDFLASRTTLIGTQPEIELLNVQVAIPSRVAQAAGPEMVRAYQREEADAALGPAAERLLKAGLRARARRVVGPRSDAIANAAQRSHADLIVMGSRAHLPLQGLLFGSTTSAVLARSTKPVLVVRDRAARPRDSLAVGIAVDGSKYGLAAVRYVLKHRDLFGAKPTFRLIHVLDEPPSLGLPGLGRTKAAQDTAFSAALAPARKPFDKAGVPVEEARLNSNNAGDAIAAFATKRRIDVLVMGSHGHGALKSVLLGSVAMRVAAKCNTPLLVIRGK